MQRLQRLKELLTSLLLTGLITLIFYLPVLSYRVGNRWQPIVLVLSQSWSTLGNPVAKYDIIRVVPVE